MGLLLVADSEAFFSFIRSLKTFLSSLLYDFFYSDREARARYTRLVIISTIEEERKKPTYIHKNQLNSDISKRIDNNECFINI